MTADRIVPELIGYADRLDVSPGEEISFMVSSDHARYDVDLVRLIHGDESPDGPGPRVDRVPGGLELADVTGIRQTTRPGSYAQVGETDALAGLASFSVAAWIFPTLAAAAGRDQAIISHQSSDGGFELGIDPAGRLSIRVGQRGERSARLVASEAVARCQWTFVAATYDAATGEGRVWQRCAHPLANACVASATGQLGQVRASAGRGRISIAARSGTEVDRFFEGRVELPLVAASVLRVDELEDIATDSATPSETRSLVALWDFAHEPSSSRIVDVGPHSLHGALVNCPMRAVTGHAWCGTEFDFLRAPREYGAIHFHSSDLDNARWGRSFAWRVPSDARSGVYAARLRAGDAVDHIPFVVLPTDETRAGRVAVLLPTMTYLAYANVRQGAKAAPFRPPYWDPIPGPHDRYLANHPEFGRSTYDTHVDGSPVCYSSYLRPIPNMRPDYRMVYVDAPRHLGADLYLIDWLEAMGIQYDVITDHHLHRLGKAALASHDVVITGSHPEYVSRPMRDSLEEWVGAGGRLMYLGGNGFYWLVTLHPDLPHTMEMRAKVGDISERRHLNGELGGLWTELGRPAERLTGIGMAGQGFDGRNRGYRRLAGSSRDDVAFAFRGIAEDELIGEFGLVMNGAAGDETDRHRPLRGAPPQTRLLASSLPHTEAYLMVDPADQVECYLTDGNRNDFVRSDIVTFETEGGGRVFSAGSISLSGSLSFNGYRNNISRMVENVLREFLEES
jgi:N,N-dimethylformamidase